MSNTREHNQNKKKKLLLAILALILFLIILIVAVYDIFENLSNFHPPIAVLSGTDHIVDVDIPENYADKAYNIELLEGKGSITIVTSGKPSEETLREFSDYFHKQHWKVEEFNINSIEKIMRATAEKISTETTEVFKNFSELLISGDARSVRLKKDKETIFLFAILRGEGSILLLIKGPSEIFTDF